MIQYYIHHFKTIYENEPWFGDGFKEKLKDVNERQAFVRPAEGVHSIAELISHIIYWRAPLLRYLQGDTKYASIEDEGNWLPVDKLKARGWKNLLTEFDQSQTELISLLSKTSDDFLNEPFRHGQNMQYLIDGVLQHDIYHLGQIGLVKKMLL